MSHRKYIARRSTTIQAGWEVLHPDDDNPDAMVYVAQCEEREAVVIANALNDAHIRKLTDPIIVGGYCELGEVPDGAIFRFESALLRGGGTMWSNGPVHQRAPRTIDGETIHVMHATHQEHRFARVHIEWLP